MAAINQQIFTNIAVGAYGSEAAMLTPSTGKRFIIKKIVFASNAAVTVAFKDTTAVSGTVSNTVTSAVLSAGAPITMDFTSANGEGGFRSGALNNILTATASATANLNGYIISVEE